MIFEFWIVIKAVVVFLFILVFLINYHTFPEKDEYFEKLKRKVEERIRLKIEADEAQLREEQESLRIKAEKAEAERIRAQSQIWVI